MRQFFKFMFASMLGFLITFVVILLIMTGIIASIASRTSQDTVDVAEKSVLHLTLTTEIVDRGGGNPFESFDFASFSPSRPIGLNNLLDNLEKAEADDNIEGIYLDMSMIPAGWSTIDELRKALKTFKESGKFIVAYGETYMQNAYYLSSVADEIYLHPEGVIDFRGINSELFFLKNMLDRLGIDPQVIRHGEYKSAGEPFFREDMSEENREQVRSYVGAIWNNVLGDIATSRGLTVNHLNEVADGLYTRNATLALEWDMIDGIAYRDEIMDMLKERLELDADDDIEFVSYSDYKRAPIPESLITPRSNNKLAVVYATGNIISGQGSDRVIGSERIAGAIREARRDTTVKAIVFRINSPGGDALASDVILREVVLASQEKPVVATMGDVAASGGYYIASRADWIMANPSTITGSIGVFGMIPNMQEFFDDKLGITFDNVKTNRFADMGSVTKPLSDEEQEIIQESIGRIYETFIEHVAEGRDIPVSTVDELGRGRVWSGTEAKRNGLIDEFGGLEAAMEKAAELADLEDYRITEYPKRKDFFTQIMEDFGGVKQNILERNLGDQYRYYRQIEEARDMTGILTRMPYDVNLN
ncbi:MAG: signal peptide peptidase SppA [Bacteroidales bacterium]